MGKNQSKESADLTHREELYCSLDMAMSSIEEFRVLCCGHYFCEKCLEALLAQEVKMCPICCKVEKRSVINLQKPCEFKGKVLLVDPPDATEKPDFEAMLNSLMIHRAATVR